MSRSHRTRHHRRLPNLYWTRADGSGEPERLTTSKNAQQPASWHPSGKFLAFEEMNPVTTMDIMILPSGAATTQSGWKAGTCQSLRQQPQDGMGSELFAGRTMARVCIGGITRKPRRLRATVPRPRPEGSGLGRRRRSCQSGRGRNLSSCTGMDGQIMVVSYTTDRGTFRVSKPQAWSPGRYQTRGEILMFDLHPDGERVALAPAAEAPNGARPDKAVFVFNFFDELRRISAAAKP